MAAMESREAARASRESDHYRAAGRQQRLMAANLHILRCVRKIALRDLHAASPAVQDRHSSPGRTAHPIQRRGAARPLHASTSIREYQ